MCSDPDTDDEACDPKNSQDEITSEQGTPADADSVMCKAEPVSVSPTTTPQESNTHFEISVVDNNDDENDDEAFIRRQFSKRLPSIENRDTGDSDQNLISGTSEKLPPIPADPTILKSIHSSIFIFPTICPVHTETHGNSSPPHSPIDDDPPSATTIRLHFPVGDGDAKTNEFGVSTSMQTLRATRERGQPSDLSHSFPNPTQTLPGSDHTAQASLHEQ
ncbi:hypothetical protein BLNAU_15127 [Blattamonas nauphoetae]|uniref:Uncharacterized protein n=1 Tax=Blattamonas nauphoetae TaxID=2049346 RepID=A0ABQ9XE71_9EUKA|nr:hypothetical protein BLNAU_15127 [Blattamonas nauphoetae]